MSKGPKRVYDTAQWRHEVRPRILARDKHQCQVPLPNGRTCLKPARAVDHIIPVSEGGAPFTGHNLRAACTSCNTRLRNMRRAALARRQLGEPEPRTRPAPNTTAVVSRLEW